MKEVETPIVKVAKSILTNIMELAQNSVKAPVTSKPTRNPFAGFSPAKSARKRGDNSHWTT